MSRDHYDFLIEQLLRETMGGDRPRDMTARVMARVERLDQTRRASWIVAGAALAASLAIAVSIFLFWPQKYGQPAVQNIARQDGGADDVTVRGIPLVTPVDQKGTVKFGNYVVGEVWPNTLFTIAGEPHKEAVLLEQGRIDFTVTKNRGTFEVVVGPASVLVTGTRFGVDVSRSINESESRIEKKMYVFVEEGGVVVRTRGRKRELKSGDSVEFTISSEAISEPRIRQIDERPQSDAPRAGGPQNNPIAPAPTPQRNERPDQPNRAGRGDAPVRGSDARGLLSPSVAVQDPKIAELKVIVGPGPFEFEGVLQRLGPYYVLRTERGIFFLGNVDIYRTKVEAAGLTPGPECHVHVQFGGGDLKEIKSLPARNTNR